MKEDCPTYHAFILTKDRKLYEGAATRLTDTDWQVGINRVQHPTIDEKKLLTNMDHVLVDMTKEFR